MNEELTIDQRLQFLLQSTESLHSSLQQMHGIVKAEREEQDEQRKQEAKRWDRLNRAIRAAVLEYFKQEDGAE